MPKFYSLCVLRKREADVIERTFSEKRFCPAGALQNLRRAERAKISCVADTVKTASESEVSVPLTNDFAPQGRQKIYVAQNVSNAGALQTR